MSRRTPPSRRNYEEKNNDQSTEEQMKHSETIEYIIKILISGEKAWTISSRNEAKVVWMAQKFESDVRLSRNDDFYPGTGERICLISGTIKAIKTTLDWILHINNEENNEHTVVILVPKTSLGALLNRGYGIKSLREREQVEIHVPEYNGEHILKEVCTTVTGKQENVIEAIIAIAKIIKNDPFSAICRNISYQEFNIYIRKKELNNMATHFATMPRISQQQIPMMNNVWTHQYNQHHNMHYQYMSQQRTPFTHQEQQFKNIQPYQQQDCSNFYYNNQNNPYQQQKTPFFQQQQLNYPEINVQCNIQQTETQQETTNEEISETEIKVNGENNNKSAIKEENNSNEIGNPIPSMTAFWRRASSDTWRSGNRAQQNNGQSNVEVIPGFN